MGEIKLEDDVMTYKPYIPGGDPDPGFEFTDIKASIPGNNNMLVVVRIYKGPQGAQVNNQLKSILR